ncbi:MAG: SDR family oxidoreductase [Alphaproteobacteria bacterium]|nr:SDR family oxidoreductase [Alphaproteobacteria bacterium]
MSGSAKAKVVLITGASAGIGAAVAKRLAGARYNVFGTSRNAVAPPPAPGVRMLVMDVRDQGAIAACVASVIESAGRIDVLVNNAGYGIAASVEDTLAADMQNQLDTNLLGPLRVCQAVLPHMRAQGSGRIIQISSLAARIAIPFQGAYSASKSALKGMTEAMSMELKPFGIDVVMVEPGDTKSNFTAARVWTQSATASEVYRARARHAIKVMEVAEQAGPPADKVARIVERAISAPRPKLRYVSASAMESMALSLQKILPSRMFERLIASNYEPPKSKAT